MRYRLMFCFFGRIHSAEGLMVAIPQSRDRALPQSGIATTILICTIAPKTKYQYTNVCIACGGISNFTAASEPIYILYVIFKSV